MLDRVTYILCMCQAAVSFAPGVVLVLAPQLVMGIFGLQLDAASAFVSRVQGAVSLGVALLFWQGRRITLDPRKGLMQAGALTNSLLVIITAVTTAAGTINQVGWLAVGLHSMLTVGFLCAIWLYRNSAHQV